MKRITLLAAITSIFIFSANLTAGIQNIKCDSPNEGKGHSHQYDYSGMGEGNIGISEQLGKTENNSVHFTGSCDLNTTINLTKEVTNKTDISWTSYILTLDVISGNGNGNGGCDAEFVLDPTPTSDVFSDISPLSPYQIVFNAPDSVLPGETVTFDFSILVSSTNINFSLDQNPVPEPVSVALLGLGALFIRKRK